MHRTRSHLPSIGFCCATLIALAACGGTSPATSPASTTTTPSGAAASPSAAMTKPSAAAASPLVSLGPDSRFTSTAFAVPVSFSLAGGWRVMNNVHSIIDLAGPDRGAGPLNVQDAGVMDIGSTTVPGITTSYMPWPKDMYAWLKSRPEFKTQAPKAITVGGRPATQIDADATVPKGTRIEFVCSKDSNCWLLDHNDRWRFVEVKDSDGSGVVWITNGIPAPAFDAYAQALDQLLRTFEFH